MRHHEFTTSQKTELRVEGGLNQPKMDCNQIVLAKWRNILLALGIGGSKSKMARVHRVNETLRLGPGLG